MPSTHLPSSLLQLQAPEASVDAALGLLVTHRITGLPVVDAGGRVVGVVSDFDLLALDSGAGAPAPGAGGGVFPAPGADWASFLASREAAALSCSCFTGCRMALTSLDNSPTSVASLDSLPAKTSETSGSVQDTCGNYY